MDQTDKCFVSGAGDRDRTGDVQLGKLHVPTKQTTYATHIAVSDSLKPAPIDIEGVRRGLWSADGEPCFDPLFPAAAVFVHLIFDQPSAPYAVTRNVTVTSPVTFLPSQCNVTRCHKRRTDTVACNASAALHRALHPLHKPLHATLQMQQKHPRARALQTQTQTQTQRALRCIRFRIPEPSGRKAAGISTGKGF